MPVASLPSPNGIGTLGQAARDFADFIKKAGQSYWQMLPIGPTSYGDSPYQSFSSYAGNPYFIDLDDLYAEGLLDDDYKTMNWGENPAEIDYALMYEKRFDVLRTAATRIREKNPHGFVMFTERQQHWLPDYALFMAEKAAHGGNSWLLWEEELRLRDEDAMEKARKEFTEEILFWEAVQFLFFLQWNKLKTYVNDLGLKLIGDIPIYVALDSADVWANPGQFQLDENMVPTEVAGCPPDGFSADGQLWGNPLFDWEKMKEDGYEWWMNRLCHQFELFDIIRIDHFRGFDSYYAIPYGDTTARNGRWKEGPGIHFFRTMEEKTGIHDIIAEDLGFLTPSVRQLLADSGYPGMKVLEFAFDSRDGLSDYLPHTYPKHCVVYAGTHDNETICGWMETAPKADVENAVAYMGLNKEEGYNWGMMRTAWSSVADTAIMQMQDLLGLGHEARINTPATLGGNWVWKCPEGAFTDELAEKIADRMKLYGRYRK